MSCEKGPLTGHKISGVKFVLVDGKSFDSFTILNIYVVCLTYMDVRLYCQLDYCTDFWSF